VRGCLEVAALVVGGIARQSAPPFYGLRALREDGDAVPRALAMPDRAVARSANVAARKSRVERLELLEAGDIRRLFLEPEEQVRQAPADAVDVEGRELDAGGFQPGKSVCSMLSTRWISTGFTT
jgi:hypothetical protein